MLINRGLLGMPNKVLQHCGPMCKLLNLQEKVKRMTPEQRAKYEARQERVQTKRAMKSRMIRI